MTPLSAPTLHGPRVGLRPVEVDDHAVLAAILAEPEVARWWVHGPLEDAVAELFEVDESSAILAIEVDGEGAGMLQFSEETEPDYRHAGIDLFVGARWQGQGIGPEAIRLIAGYLFDARGHHRITIDPAAANARAIRAYEKVGFRRVGVMRRYERGADGTWHDGLLMDLLRGELMGA
ncbi:MAG: GNAT family N-acetyltransferase [Chloroflexi bacterium RBG_16_70_13]|nr:MAG: GNAT family N-acetyltransferase [Chloroflexi bacterium RBG_16_70_13]